MTKHVLITSLIAAFTLPAFAQVPVTAAPKTSVQIRDDNHEIRPDLVDQRSDDKDLNANEARDLRKKKIKEGKMARKYHNKHRDDIQQPSSDAIEEK